MLRHRLFIGAIEAITVLTAGCLGVGSNFEGKAWKIQCCQDGTIMVQRYSRKPELAALRNSDALREKEKASRADVKQLGVYRKSHFMACVAGLVIEIADMGRYLC